MADDHQTIIGRSSSNGLSSFRTIHDHILPSGWSCKYDYKTKKYYFIQESEKSDSEESEHQERPEFEHNGLVWKTIMMKNSSEHHKIKATSQEANIDRIFRQFPNVEKSYITQLVKIYNNRENLVISALLSESHSRQNVILDEALFYKLKQSFPHIEPEIIRKLLIQHENREHPTIEALLNLFGLFNTTRYEHSKKPQLKLKYLKFAFPNIDEIVLLDLLFKNDFDAGRVIKHLKSIGHQYSEVIEIKLSKISETALLKEASDRLQASRPKSLLFQERYHPNLWEQEDIRKTITEIYPSIDIFLVNWALEATKFDIKLTKLFLDTMTPQDADKYLIRSLPDKTIYLRNILISRQVQTNSINQDLFGRFLLLKSDDRTVERVNKSTWTKEDGIIKRTLFKLAIGPSKENRQGPNVNKIIKPHERNGPIIARKGPNCNNKQGPDLKVKEKFLSTRILKQGPQKTNKKGAMGKQIVRVKDEKNAVLFLNESSVTSHLYCFY